MAFKLQKTKHILIFGNNVRTSMVMSNLKEQGFTNITITDSKLQVLDGDLKNTVLFIAFQNALQHDKVAEDMWEKGFQNIVYLPTQGCVNDKKADLLRKMYNVVLYGKIDENMEIPSYEEVKKRGLAVENGVISNEQGLVRFWARIENVYVNDICTKINKFGIQYYGVNLANVEHYRSLFELMGGKEECPENLKEYYEAQSYLVEGEKVAEDKLFDRYQLALMYKREMNKGMNFFISSAPIVVGNDYGGLHIKEGLHRAVFLMTQNLAYIPVMMSEREFYRMYSDNGALKKLRNYFRQKKIEETVTPIAHPAFYNFPAKKENCEPSVLTAVNRFLGIWGLEGKRILDMSDYNSYFARNAGRRSCKNAVEEIDSWEGDEISFQLAGLYNELLNIKNVNILSGSPPVSVKEYDIVFIMGNHEGIFDNIDLLKKMGENTKEMLFFEANINDIDEKKRMMMSEIGFAEYIAIHRYYDGLSKREVGVFLKARQ